ncbi:hypothetical protein B0H14DRAFT_3433148 [Mycena olivaceomarginata]|nr:hypothetical protein B0H14DRAFT_3433148 [Mycena olivaceomarginata]
MFCRLVSICGATEEIKPNPLCAAPPARSSLALLRVLSTTSPRAPSTLARHVLHTDAAAPQSTYRSPRAPLRGRPGAARKQEDLRADATGAGWCDAAPAAAAASGSAKHGVGAAECAW